MVGVFFYGRGAVFKITIFICSKFFFYNPTLLHKDKAISGFTAEKREPL